MYEHCDTKAACPAGSFGNSMLHCAAQSGKIEMVKYFIDNNFDVNQKNQLSESPLHLATTWYAPGMYIIMCCSCKM